MWIELPEDAGNIEVLSGRTTQAPLLQIRPDNRASFAQWFHFRCLGVAGVPLTLKIVNAASCSYAKGWEGYRAVASTDGEDWFRVPTRYEGGALVIEHTPEADEITYAYFAPYSVERRERCVAEWASHPEVRTDSLLKTPDRNELPYVRVGGGAAPVWIVARQHPGESMGEWFVEGLLRALLTPQHTALRDLATFHVVPCVNPDGARRGNHRTNARGTDLNRAWHEPDQHLSPEVAAIRAVMATTGMVFALDVHGDEEIPHNFASGGEGTPSWDEEKAARKRWFVERWAARTREFQLTHGYPISGPGEANLTVCSNHLVERWGALALTIEQPFTDHLDQPDERTGWSPQRAQALGASVLDPLLDLLRERR